MSILSVDDKPVKQAFPAMIRSAQNHNSNHREKCRGSPLHASCLPVRRSQDVREQNKDDVQIVNSFRPGDFVKATVISLGDTRSYFLSTAAANLGVVHATCDGVAMVAVSEDMMECPDTHTKQPRKVALNV